MTTRFDQERARIIGRSLFQKYDIYKTSVLQPKQCYQLFSDFCYRILESQSMHQVLDFNKDKKVTVQDFENLAIKYLCSSKGSLNYAPSQSNSRNIESNTRTTTTYITKTTNSVNSSQKKSKKNLTRMAQARLDVVRRLFQKFDKDRSGFLTENQVPFILEETYKEMGQIYKPTKDDVRSYMKMVDTNGDGRISLAQFEDIVLISLEKAGLQVYNNSIH